LGGDPNAALPDGWDAIDPKTGTPVGVDKGWDYAPGASVAHTVQAMAQKTVQWQYTLAKAYMQSVPVTVRDALVTSYRSLPSVADDARRYAKAVLDGRKVDEYRTLGLLTATEAESIASSSGFDVEKIQGFDWAIGKYAPIHINNEHGDASTEAPRGQRVPTSNDYGLLPEIILAPDKLWTEDDGKTVLIEKTIGLDRYLIAWAIKNKRKMVALTSMRVYRRAPRAQRP
jgi:hypothetical protein